jgi:two-component system response regulator FixJ
MEYQEYIPAEPTVFIIDDDDAICERLCWLVQSVQLKVESYTSANEFLENYHQERPGCLVTDVRMPGLSGIELLEKLAAENNHIPVIVTTGLGDVQMAVRAMKAGAFDFIEKPVNAQLLLERIQQAIKYDTNQLPKEIERKKILKRLAKLTAREHEIMNQVITGKSNKVIARELNISHKTVEAHRTKVMEKMEAINLADLVRLCMTCEPL